MKIKLNDGSPASTEAILRFEASFGRSISNSFKSFVATNDGAIPEGNCFKVGTANESTIDQFIPLAKIEQQKSYIENLPEGAYPIAWAAGGNFIIIDEARGGSVCYWDHEIPEQITEVASDFSTFMDRLEPFDTAAVELKPRQVKRVWVDPEFLKRIKQ